MVSIQIYLKQVIVQLETVVELIEQLEDEKTEQTCECCHDGLAYDDIAVDVSDAIFIVDPNGVAHIVTTDTDQIQEVERTPAMLLKLLIDLASN